MKINCIAVDDEPLALGLINTFIEQTPFLNAVGTYSSAVEAMEALHLEGIQLIFLDIQMPKLNGLELAKLVQSFNKTAPPKIIFTTAYNQFAVDSYKVEALDYLLKPYDYQDFLRAANKAMVYFEKEAAPPAKKPAENAEEYLFVRVEYQYIKVDWNDIVYIEGLKDYVKIHLQSSAKPLLTLMTLKSLEEKLPTARFMRIHRSYIISLEKIASVSKATVRIGNTEITIGEQYKSAMQLFLSKWL